jgi:NAD(P)-dependent dehydrogenase (short-subunit alcohol dehydrogenase family)
MTTATTQRQPEGAVQIVAVIEGCGGIGLETARRARAEGAGVILTGGNRGRLERTAAEPGALSSSSLRRRRSGRARAILRRPGGTGRPCDGHGRRPAVC